MVGIKGQKTRLPEVMAPIYLSCREWENWGDIGSVHLQSLIILTILIILKMSLPIFGDKSVGAGGLWLSPSVL